MIIEPERKIAMKTYAKLLSLLLAACMVLSLFAACGGSTGGSSSAPAEVSEASQEEAEAEEAVSQEETEAEAPQAEETEDAGEAQETEEEAEEAELTANDYPWGIVRAVTEAEPLPLVDEPVTLTAWDYCVPPVFEVIHDYGTDGQVYRELQERTGVTLSFTTANLLQANSDMALMIAANEMPDIIFNFGMFNSYNADDLVDGDLIVNYCDYEDVMPNYFDIINNNPDIARDIYTDDGNIIYAANISSDLTPNSGPAIRQDWLDTDGLNTPVTVDDLHDVLLAFQSQNDSPHPMWVSSVGNSSLAGAYGISYNGTNNGVGGWIWSEEEGMQYCLPMDGFKDYVQLLTDWYAEGLLSPDFVSQSSNGTAQDSEITGNASGFFNSSVMSLTNLAAYEPEANVQPVRPMVLQEGDLVASDDAGTSRISKGGASIACTCPDIELACRIINYFYSDDGITLANYGVEGVSFEYDENGDPQLTELVTNNPEGKAFGLALILYTSSTPCSIDIKERNNGGYNEAQVKALTLWHRDNDAPRITAPGSLWDIDSQTEYSNIATDLTSYVTTNVLQFITGSKDMSQWDEFVKEATSSFDIERLKELSDNAVEAYLNK